MKTYLALTARILGTYAAILAFVHGIFEMQQGKAIVKSISINAVGNGCVADQIWHACFPSMTIWPTYLTAGLLTMTISALLFFFIVFFLNHQYSGWVIIAFAFANLLFGGGFIPTFAAIMAAIAILINKKQKQKHDKDHKPFMAIWIILLSAYILYAAGGWLLGSYFNTIMVENSFLIFFIMDLLTPILSIIFARMADNHKSF